MAAAPSDFLFLDNLPPPILSSLPRAWDGIVVEQRYFLSVSITLTAYSTFSRCWPKSSEAATSRHANLEDRAI